MCTNGTGSRWEGWDRSPRSPSRDRAAGTTLRNKGLAAAWECVTSWWSRCLALPRASVVVQVNNSGEKVKKFSPNPGGGLCPMPPGGHTRVPLAHAHTRTRQLTTTYRDREAWRSAKRPRCLPCRRAAAVRIRAHGPAKCGTKCGSAQGCAGLCRLCARFSKEERDTIASHCCRGRPAGRRITTTRSPRALTGALPRHHSLKPQPLPPAPCRTTPGQRRGYAGATPGNTGATPGQRRHDAGAMPGQRRWRCNASLNA